MRYGPVVRWWLLVLSMSCALTHQSESDSRPDAAPRDTHVADTGRDAELPDAGPDRYALLGLDHTDTSVRVRLREHGRERLLTTRPRAAGPALLLPSPEGRGAMLFHPDHWFTLDDPDRDIGIPGCSPPSPSRVYAVSPDTLYVRCGRTTELVSARGRRPIAADCFVRTGSVRHRRVLVECGAPDWLAMLDEEGNEVARFEPEDEDVDVWITGPASIATLRVRADEGGSRIEAEGVDLPDFDVPEGARIVGRGADRRFVLVRTGVTSTLVDLRSGRSTEFCDSRETIITSNTALGHCDRLAHVYDLESLTLRTTVAVDVRPNALGMIPHEDGYTVLFRQDAGVVRVDTRTGEAELAWPEDPPDRVTWRHVAWP